MPSTFEDALVLENLDLFASGEGTGLFGEFAQAVEGAIAGADLSSLGQDLYAAIGGRSKAKFALDLLTSVDDVNAVTVPAYISSGLKWLEEQLRAVPVLPSVEVKSASADSEAGA